MMNYMSFCGNDLFKAKQDWAEKFIRWKIHMMTSYLWLMTFLINGIQALQHQWKKCVDCKGNYAEK